VHPVGFIEQIYHHARYTKH